MYVHSISVLYCAHLCMKCSLGIFNFLAAAPAKSLQSYPTLCDPIKCSPPGSPIPWILQAKTLEWVAISFSNGESEQWDWSRSVMSDSQRPHGLQPTRLFHPWDFPGKSTGLGCHCLLPNFLEEFSSLSHYIFFSPLYFFALITKEDLLYLSLLFFETLHLNDYIFPFLPYFLLLFFS